MTLRNRLANIAFILQFPVEFLYSFFIAFYFGEKYSISLLIPKMLLFALLLFLTLNIYFINYNTSRNCSKYY